MNSRYVICDIEATGLHEAKEPIEIALITLEEDKVIEVYETLINPLMPVSEFIHDLTSISPRELASSPKFYEVAEAIRLRLEGGIFVSHNTDFDLTLLKKKFREMGQELKVRSFCTLKVAQEEIPGLKNYNLDALCSFFGIKIKERHRAIGDARATLELFKELRELRVKARPRARHLPHHERYLRNLPSRPGLVHFKDAAGKTIRLEPSFSMEKTARTLLEVRPENRRLLEAVESVEGEVTGSVLIAEFRKLLFHPFRPHWSIRVEERGAERFFKIRPHRRGEEALWYFEDYEDARRKLGLLREGLKADAFAYREGGKSKEEIMRHNRKVEQLSREARFPTENLLLTGEGRVLSERSLVLVRQGHVVGYGYSKALEEEIQANPEAHLTRRFSRHLGADLVAMRYLRELRNARVKNEGWRSLAVHVKLGP